MTDQTDRQDGDGLPRYTITQNDIERLHGAAHGGALLGGDNAYEGCLTVESILAEIVARGAVQPTRDAAEGAAPNVINALGWLLDAIKSEGVEPTPLLKRRFADAEKALLSATPKPAPDAMREALAAKIEKAWRWEHRTSVGHFVESLATDEQALIVSALRSAPVPSPDGAGKYGPVDWSKDVLDTVYGRPSGTGAAEPVAWLCEDLIFPGQHQAILNRDLANARMRQPDAWKLTPLYAAPPVRGDRETLHDAIMGAAKLHTHDHALALKIANDAIPQSGAGEREQYEFPYQRTFDSIVAATDVLSGPPNQKQLSISVAKFQEAFNNHRDQRALSRQAPQSSREG